MTAPPRRGGRLRPALLSGLVFPGLGQLVTGHPWRGLAFGGASVALLAAVVLRVMRETRRLMPEDPVALLDPALPFRLAVEIHRANASFFLWATAGIVGLWLGSIADAWSAPGDQLWQGPGARLSILASLSRRPGRGRARAMRFMIVVKATRESEAGVMPGEALLAQMAAYHEELAKAGVLLDASGLRPSTNGWRVQYSGAKRTVTDGPFTEAKELIAGYTLIQVQSREEALEWVRRFPNPAGDGKEGEIEVREVFELGDFGPDRVSAGARERRPSSGRRW